LFFCFFIIIYFQNNSKNMRPSPGWVVTKCHVNLFPFFKCDLNALFRNWKSQFWNFFGSQKPTVINVKNSYFGKQNVTLGDGKVWEKFQKWLLCELLLKQSTFFISFLFICNFAIENLPFSRILFFPTFKTLLGSQNL